MKKFILTIILFSGLATAFGKHITGGEIIYDLVGSTSSSKTYRITLLLFRDQACDAVSNCALLPATVKISVFNRDNNSRFGNYNVNQSQNSQVPGGSVPICITNPPNLNYRVGYYSFTVTLPNNNQGYIASFQTCCRIDGISNVGNNSGATYTTEIPPGNIPVMANGDFSPRFTQGISVVCFNKPFTLDFSAIDPDGDELIYSLCSGYDGGGATSADPTYTASPPPYGILTYINGFSGAQSLGNQASINPQTGIISGIAPDEGKYVVSVCVSSYRNGVFLAVHRKDFILTVAPCEIGGAELSPSYITCDGFTFQFQNLISSPLNQTYFWDFGDTASGLANTSTAQDTSHTFSDTGIFTVKLVVNRNAACSDSTYSQIKVYPGYFPGFTNNAPRCVNSSVQFLDETFAVYGEPNSWKWNFGDPATQADVSTLQNPAYTYTNPGTYYVTLTVGSSKGCVGIFRDTITILAKPPFQVTNDTLMCSVDDLQLFAAASSDCCVTWSPNYNINDVNSFTPIVSPDVTTTYTVAYSDDRGCSASDQVVVRVVDTVTLATGNDTTICRTDGVILSLESDALRYTWTQSPAGGTINDATLQNPVATPSLPLTTYYVTGRIGSCLDSDSIKVRTVPYPIPDAGPNQIICFGESTSLSGSGGAFYTWSPKAFLSSTTASSTVVQSPTVTVTYTLTVRDTFGCPKPVTDVVRIQVNRIIADAGPRDTSIVLNQPLQLNATGSTFYSWIGLPFTQWLNNTSIANPVSSPQDDISYVVTATDNIGCFDTDTITVHFYKVNPDFYIPTAFSPNSDGLNDVLQPIALGLKSIEAFRVYNRWGQLLYSTSQIGQGWNGKFKGADQSPGTYIFYAEGTDFRNRKFSRKGSVLLIR